jgi:trimeric autotransporter adhesin
MSTFTFTIPGAPPGTAGTIEVKGPAGLTQEQARQIFEKQLDVGAFAGIKPGAVISAATQAAQGLSAATSQVGQALSGRVGALGAGITGAVGQVGALASGALASATATVKGLASSVATAAGSTPLAGEINIADFAKSIPAVGPIANMATSEVTSALATAKNLAGQASSVLSNVGAGSFALNASQLESAGILKPGMSALVDSGSSLSSVLKSPAAFTGKDGITNIGSLLNNAGAQNNIQQTLMNNGLQQVTKLSGSLGGLPSSLTAGLGLASASLAGQAGALSDLAKGALSSLPDPSKVLSQLKNAQFGVNLANAKIPDSFKAEEIPTAVVDSVNRLGINAATTRVLGSAKIPVPSFAPSPSSVAAAVSSAVSSLSGSLGSLPTLSSIPALSGALSSLSGVPNPAALATAAVDNATAAAKGALGAVTSAIGAATGAAGRLLG